MSLAAHDPTVTEAALTELIYGKENPLLDQSIFPGRGAVTKITLANPVYHVMLDLLDAKRVQAGTLSKPAAEAAFTMTVSEAAETLGITPGAVRQALDAKRLAGVKRGPSYFLDPRSVATYRDRVVRRGPEAKHELEASIVPIDPRSGSGKTRDVLPALLARIGNVEGKSFRLKVDGFTETSRPDGHVVEGVVQSFERAAIAFAGTEGLRMFVIEPGPDENEFAFGPFFIRGNYRVVQKINNARDAAAKWADFRSKKAATDAIIAGAVAGAGAGPVGAILGGVAGMIAGGPRPRAPEAGVSAKPKSPKRSR